MPKFAKSDAMRTVKARPACHLALKLFGSRLGLWLAKARATAVAHAPQWDPALNQGLDSPRFFLENFTRVQSIIRAPPARLCAILWRDRAPPSLAEARTKTASSMSRLPSENTTVRAF